MSAAHSAARVVIPVIALRALIVWALTRILVAAVLMAGEISPRSFPPPPMAVVLLAGVLGLLDVQVRSERILWENLGVGRGMLFLVYAAGAVTGEVMLALATR